ncbi:putative endoribonuclease L-PSP family protein [Diplocarpon rosae]|nr:putative endoribonuclease L-PSP family protein [Diplocarpon rosae]
MRSGHQNAFSLFETTLASSSMPLAHIFQGMANATIAVHLAAKQDFITISKRAGAEHDMASHLVALPMHGLVLTLESSKFVNSICESSLIRDMAPSTTIKDQALIVDSKIKTCLAGAGATPRDIVQVKHYIVHETGGPEVDKLDIAERGWGERWMEFMHSEAGGHRPPDTVVGVAGLAGNRVAIAMTLIRESATANKPDAISKAGTNTIPLDFEDLLRAGLAKPDGRIRPGFLSLGGSLLYWQN